MKNAHSKIFLIFLILGALVRIIYSIYLWESEGLETAVDQLDYIQYAQQIDKQGIWLPDPSRIDAFAAPGFPLYVFVIKSITGGLWGVIFSNIVLSIFTLYLYYLIGLKLLNKNIALIVLLLAAFYFPFFMFTGQVLKETFLYFLIAVVLYGLSLKLNPKVILLIALFSVLTFHVDERYLLYTPLVLVVVWFKSRKFTYFIYTGLLILLFSMPWLIRNYQVHDRVVILTERFQSPIDRKLGNDNRLVDRSGMFEEAMKEVRDSLNAGHEVNYQSSRERKVALAMKKGLKPHDFDLAERFYFNLHSFWWPIRTEPMFIGSGWKYLKARPLYLNIFYSAYMLPLIFLFLYAMVMSIRKKEITVLCLSGVLVYHTIIHILLIGGLGRYRMPLDILLFLCAAWGLLKVNEFIRKVKSYKKSD